ncbi:MAG: hypothetical protein CM1200mP30_32650 [Pseudomonadota bacterium]|nr:MAG: hypothetical protein CM1200mP30_32650 [Pseudomonadota bacterium]
MQWRYLSEERFSRQLRACPRRSDGHACRGEAFFSHSTSIYLSFSRSALVGRFQRIENELNLEFCREQKMSVNRRPTGGGAILMGEDQLGVALMLKDWNGYKAPRELMRNFASALCEGLLIFGIKSQFRGKNDLEVEGRKIGGLGIHSNASGGYLLHCSLLVDLDTPLMLRSLNVPVEKLEARQLKSIEGRITTVRRELKKDTSLNEVRDKVRRAFSSYFGVEFEQSCYSPEEKKAIGKIGILKIPQQGLDLPESRCSRFIRRSQANDPCRIAGCAGYHGRTPDQGSFTGRRFLCRRIGSIGH